MDSAEKRALTSIGKEPRFRDVLKKLTIGDKIVDGDKAYILAVAMVLIRRYQEDRRYTSYADLAYYIILKYSLQHKDYAPLFDFAVNFGFYPIAKDLLRNGLYEGNPITACLGDIQLDRFRNAEEATLTLEQHLESSNFLSEKARETCYLAPTSFGKSSLIVDQIRQLGNHPCKIVVIVPTKSLLIQTLQMIREAGLRRKLMVHDEMFDGEESFIAIFTQERALRLLTKHDTYFDLIFVDEAHNLLKGDSRSILLSRVIKKNRTINPDHRVIYLSPLVHDANNLRLTTDQNISSHVIKFNVKEPEIFELRLNKEVYQYNRFLNLPYKIAEDIELGNYLISASGDKNFMYNYRPVKVEQLARELCDIVPVIETTEAIDQLARILSSEVHPDFYAIDHLKHGVVYLHGKLPDLVKEYLEFKYKNLPELKYVVANSVILEGMNLPIDRLFIFNTRSLQGKELMNLIGRVNRLNTIFGHGENRLSRLLPKVHFINNEEHYRVRSKMENKIKLLRSRVFEDLVKNPTLAAFDIEALSIPASSKEKYVEKVASIQENEEFLASATDTKENQIRAYLIQSGIIEFYTDPSTVIERFVRVSPMLANNPPLSWTSASMMEKIEYIFLRNIGDISDDEVSRLSYPETRSYYENHILIAQKRALNENIHAQVHYFNDRVKHGDSKMYFGLSYGEEPLETDAYPKSSKRAYVDLSNKSDQELVNLAVVKLKMEDDFVGFKLNKLIVMLFDYNLISVAEYNRYIYGTTDEQKIQLTKYGLSVSMIARLEADGQLGNLQFDDFNNLRATPAFEDYLLTVNDFYRFEIKRYIG
ncbi:MAG: DEAD/DEAH box helicase family protein [Desulfobacteraceae bacterium]|nr:DEAD/DEAH box helicase family protein [Desulfobacteraceae bacterium]MBC2751474.1 DEAD/DEAH box helicase family protein [Desulfobacteraceae bacterium]